MDEVHKRVPPLIGLDTQAKDYRAGYGAVDSDYIGSYTDYVERLSLPAPLELARVS